MPCHDPGLMSCLALPCCRVVTLVENLKPNRTTEGVSWGPGTSTCEGRKAIGPQAEGMGSHDRDDMLPSTERRIHDSTGMTKVGGLARGGCIAGHSEGGTDGRA